MVCQSRLAGVVLSVLAHGTSFASSSPVKRETSADFRVDDGFQADGGVQVYFDVLPPAKVPDVFRTLDRQRRLAGFKDALHVAVTRLSYVVEKDVAFFSEQRLRDLSYLRALAPQMQISARTDGGFQINQTPSNTLSIEYHADAGFAGELGLAHGAPVLVQENTDFARVMGWRTGAWSATWTFHQSLGPQRTRVTALTVSSLYNLPPDFMGGRERFSRETVDGALAIIERLRSYEP